MNDDHPLIRFRISYSPSDLRDYILSRFQNQRLNLPVSENVYQNLRSFFLYDKKTQLWVLFSNSLPLIRIITSDLGKDYLRDPSFRLTIDDTFYEVVRQLPGFNYNKSDWPLPESWALNSNVVNILTGELRPRTPEDFFTTEILIPNVSTEELQQVKDYFLEIVENTDEFLNDLRLLLADRKSVLVRASPNKNCNDNFEKMLIGTRLFTSPEQYVLHPDRQRVGEYLLQKRQSSSSHTLTIQDDIVTRQTSSSNIYKLIDNRILKSGEICDRCARILPIILFHLELRFSRTKRAR